MALLGQQKGQTGTDLRQAEDTKRTSEGPHRQKVQLYQPSNTKVFLQVSKGIEIINECEFYMEDRSYIRLKNLLYC